MKIAKTVNDYSLNELKAIVERKEKLEEILGNSLRKAVDEGFDLDDISDIARDIIRESKPVARTIKPDLNQGRRV